MCTYQTDRITVRGSAKGPTGWIPVTNASVYFDHPVVLPVGHAMTIDFLNPERGPGARVAVELDATSARALAASILATLDAVPADLLEGDRLG